MLSLSLLAAVSLGHGILLPVRLPPSKEHILYGTYSGGNLASWAADDNDARKMCKFLVHDPRMFLRVELTFQTGTTQVPTVMELHLKAGPHTPGLQTVTVLYVDREFQKVASTVMHETLIDTRIYIAKPTTPNWNYVREGGEVVVWIEVRTGGPSTALFPCTSFEYANLVLTY